MDDLLAGFDNVSDEGEEVVTSGEILQELEEAWMNEKFSPELLASKSEAVDCIMEQITEMEENIQRAKKGSSTISIYKMELDRVRFIVSSYLRTRLRKIETYCSHMLEEEKALGDRGKMSPQECAYAKEYKENIETHLKSTALNQMPQNLQNMDSKQTMVHPPLDTYVFLRVKESTEPVLVDEETSDSKEDSKDIIEFEKGDQHIMRYRPISSLVATGVLALI